MTHNLLVIESPTVANLLFIIVSGDSAVGAPGQALHQSARARRQACSTAAYLTGHFSKG